MWLVLKGASCANLVWYQSTCVFRCLTFYCDINHDKTGSHFHSLYPDILEKNHKASIERPRPYFKSLYRSLEELIKIWQPECPEGGVYNHSNPDDIECSFKSCKFKYQSALIMDNKEITEKLKLWHWETATSSAWTSWGLISITVDYIHMIHVASVLSQHTTLDRCVCHLREHFITLPFKNCIVFHCLILSKGLPKIEGQN